MADFQYDFCGWATKNDYRCSDGVVIKRDAFAKNDGQIVPLVWQHNHDDIENYLGHALLENRNEGVYMYGSLNNTERADVARELLRHGDITTVSIFAKKLKEVNKNILQGDIKEVSLVMAPANPGAKIEHVMIHGETDDDSYAAEIGFNLEDNSLDLTEGVVELGLISHADDNDSGNDDSDSGTDKSESSSKESERSVSDVLDTLNDDQKAAVEFLVNSTAVAAVEAALNETDKEEKDMRHSLFEGTNESNEMNFSISKDDEKAIIMHAAEKGGVGSVKAAVEDFLDMTNESVRDYIRHEDGDDSGDDDTQDYGIIDIDMLFPDAKAIFDTPTFIKRRTEWVNEVMTGVRRIPFSRIKSIHADITEDEARAKGYIKGDQKVTEVFSLLKRETTPTTIYKLQKLDRDDVLDITSFDVIVWLKGEMRLMWEEEAARAMLVSDGRNSLDRNHIPTDKIRPIYGDDENELYAVPIRYEVAANATEDAITKAQIRTIKKGKKYYRGTGNPTFFTTEDNLANMLLLEDGIGHPLYDTVEKVATALGVRKIVTVPVMDGLKRTVTVDGTPTEFILDGLVVNLVDYAVGADRGGQATMFEDFDLDFNKLEYLYEGRCSGALIIPKSALIVEHSVASSQG